MIGAMQQSRCGSDLTSMQFTKAVRGEVSNHLMYAFRRIRYGSIPHHERMSPASSLSKVHHKLMTCSAHPQIQLLHLLARPQRSA